MILWIKENKMLSSSIMKPNPGSVRIRIDSSAPRLRKRDDRIYPSAPSLLPAPPAYSDEDLTMTYPVQDVGHGQGLTPPEGNGQTVLVKAEELCIVLILLLLWVGAIALFFNRWGKIRMLEPYQPKFCEAHRASCPIATDVAPLQHFPRSFSKFNLSTAGDVSPHFAKCTYHGAPPSGSSYASGGGGGPAFLTTSALIASSSRPRQNSVFVTSAHSAASTGNAIKLKPNARKAKSAIDLSSLVLSEEFFESVRRNSKNSVTQL